MAREFLQPQLLATDRVSLLPSVRLVTVCSSLLRIAKVSLNVEMVGFEPPTFGCHAPERAITRRSAKLSYISMHQAARKII